jgi:hypothetical protein
MPGSDPGSGSKPGIGSRSILRWAISRVRGGVYKSGPGSNPAGGSDPGLLFKTGRRLR